MGYLEHGRSIADQDQKDLNDKYHYLKQEVYVPDTSRSLKNAPLRLLGATVGISMCTIPEIEKPLKELGPVFGTFALVTIALLSSETLFRGGNSMIKLQQLNADWKSFLQSEGLSLD